MTSIRRNNTRGWTRCHRYVLVGDEVLVVRVEEDGEGLDEVMADEEDVGEEVAVLEPEFNREIKRNLSATIRPLWYSIIIGGMDGIDGNHDVNCSEIGDID